MIDPDRVVYEALHSPLLSGYHGFFSAITLLGSAGLWLVILAMAFIIGKWREITCILIIAVAFGTIINEDLKGIVQRVRPGDIIVAGYFVHKSYSFPSGHAQTAFVIATVLSAFLDRRYNVITYLLAGAVCVSRIYLGVHYFTDVVAGAIIGTLLGVLIIYGLHRLGLYHGKGILGITPRPVENLPRKRLHHATIKKYPAAVLAAGFAIAIITLFLSWYLVSLALIGVLYIVLLMWPSLSPSTVVHQ